MIGITRIRRRCALGLALALLLAPFSSVLALSSLHQRPTSDVRVSRGRSIAELIARHPGRSIEIETNRERPMMVMNPKDGVLASAMADSEEVARVEVTSVRGQVDPLGDWITTDVHVRLLEVLKETRGLPTVSGEFSFQQDGGEVQVDGVTVRAVIPWAAEFEVGKEYLIFARLRDDGSVQVWPNRVFERTGNSYRNLIRGIGAQTLGETPEIVLQRLRRGGL